ncbi:hypothetical protein L6452_24968 [Arctium lappa]|uniref:Uncharacterized protein n=1 Tax=Arctium lappa TaxID=4217 RepID=A0ACB9AAZ1_ARCLA|nr:hypothetical protein L6452_24968 [Arctium lappa]
MERCAGRSHQFRSSSSSSSPSKIPHSSLYRGVAFSEFDAIFSQLHYLLRICFRDDSGKVRMKPRDPHRAMHSKSLQKPIYVGLDQPVSNLPTVEGIKRNPKQDDPKVLSLKPLLAPNIAWQFTKNLKNIVDIMSVSQTTVSDSV